MIFNKDSKRLREDLEENSIHAVITDPPYAMDIMNNDWDKILPPQEIWDRCYEVLRPGGFLLSFGHSRFYHRMVLQLENAGFVIKDCLAWGYATSYTHAYNISKAFDRSYGFPIPEENYEPMSDESIQWQGYSNVLKTAYEPIALAQKPLSGTLIENLVKWQVGALNIDECRIPYASEKDKQSLLSFLHFKNKDYGDSRYFSANRGGKKQVNVHPDGRWPANLLWLDPLFADYDHIFMIPKPDKNEKRDYNKHDTVKPLRLIEHLIRLVSPSPETVGDEVYILDPFLGSGTTGVACRKLNREFYGYELDEDQFETAKNRIGEKVVPDMFD